MGFGGRQLRGGLLLEHELVLLVSVCVCAEFCMLRVGCADDDMSLTCLRVGVPSSVPNICKQAACVK